MSSFGEFLYTLRKEKNMTQAELAETLGVTNKAVSKWETGEAMPETSQLLPISRIFGVSVDELLNGERATETPPNEEPEKETDEKADEVFVHEWKDHLFTRGRDDENKTLLEKICGAVCSAIMMVGVIVYLCLGIFTDSWHPEWVILPVCGLCCGITGIVFDLCNPQKREKKLRRGENPYTGGICGIIMLSCIITYLLLGALGNMWHPYWIIVVAGGLVCGIVGPIGEVITAKKKK